MVRRAVTRPVGFRRRFDFEVPEQRHLAGGGSGLGVHVVAPEMPDLDERGPDVEGVGLVEHGLDQAFDGVFSCAVRAESGNAQGSRSAAEDQVAASTTAGAAAAGRGRRPARAKVRQGELNDVEGADEVGLELGADLVVVLVLTRSDHA